MLSCAGRVARRGVVPQTLQYVRHMGKGVQAGFGSGSAYNPKWDEDNKTRFTPVHKAIENNKIQELKEQDMLREALLRKDREERRELLRKRELLKS